MNHSESIEKLLKALQALKVTLRDTAEPGVNRDLDEAIAELQSIIESNEISDRAFAKALQLLDKFFTSLPSIVKLIEFFRG